MALLMQINVQCVFTQIRACLLREVSACGCIHLVSAFCVDKCLECVAGVVTLTVMNGLPYDVERTEKDSDQERMQLVLILVKMSMGG